MGAPANDRPTAESRPALRPGRAAAVVALPSDGAARDSRAADSERPDVEPSGPRDSGIERVARAVRRGLALLGFDVGEPGSGMDERTVRSLLEYREAKGHSAAGHDLRFTLHALGMDVLRARPADGTALEVADVLFGGADG